MDNPLTFAHIDKLMNVGDERDAMTSEARVDLWLEVARSVETSGGIPHEFGVSPETLRWVLYRDPEGEEGKVLVGTSFPGVDSC